MPKRCTPRYEDWPEADRISWARAVAPGDYLDEGGPAANWSRETCRKVVGGYARWLAYLASTDQSLLELPPAARVCGTAVRRYLAEECAGMEPVSVWNCARQLYDMMRATAPDQDWGWLKALVARLAREIKPKSKLGKLVDPLTLITLGMHLMNTASDLPSRPTHALENKYRDGLLIALLAQRPLRRANIAAIRLGRQLRQVGGGYWLVFEAQETKNRKPLEVPFPADLLCYLDRYLTEIRPRFPRAEAHDGLWASEKGRPMSPSTIYDRVRRRTKLALGRAVNLHSMRDSAATQLAEADREGHNNSRDLLGHARLETTERHYIHRDRRKAVHAHQQFLRQRRTALARGRPGRRESGMTHD